jgi:hypothetical protein
MDGGDGSNGLCWPSCPLLAYLNSECGAIRGAAEMRLGRFAGVRSRRDNPLVVTFVVALGNHNRSHVFLLVLDDHLIVFLELFSRHWLPRCRKRLRLTDLF